MKAIKEYNGIRIRSSKYYDASYILRRCSVDVPPLIRCGTSTGHVRDICGTCAGHPILYPTFSIGRGIGKAMVQPCQAPGNYVLALMVIRPDGSR